RIELFDDEIDSIRFFDAETQRSLEKINAIRIGPATEMLLTNEDMVSGSHRLEKALADTLKNMQKQEAKEALVASIEHEDRKSTRLNSSHVSISYAVFCLKK